MSTTDPHHPSQPDGAPAADPTTSPDGHPTAESPADDPSMSSEAAPADEAFADDLAEAQTSGDSEAEPDDVDELDEDEDDEGLAAPPERRVVVIGRGAFLSMVGLAALLIIALGAATTVLYLRNQDTDDPVVARVNGEAIHRSEYDRAVAARDGADVLDSIIVEHLVAAEAAKRGVTVSAEDEAQLLAEQKKQFSSDQEFQDALARNNYTEADFTKRLRLIELLKRLVADKTAVTDDEIAKRYEQTKDQYQGKSLVEVKDDVKQDLVNEKAQTALPAFLSQLKSAASIQTFLPGKAS